jgi:outer membrane protein OmpA-like peptidoglycan-associated protein
MTKIALLGLFIFAALMILFAAVFVIGDQQLLFTKSYHLRTEFFTVSGLLNGAEVRIGGLRNGTVDAIRLPSRPEGKLVVSMSLDNSTRNLVKQDSIAAIETEGLLGNKFVAISFGSLEATAVKDGDTIPSAPPLDLSDLLKKSNAIMDTTQSAMKNVDTASAQIAAITSRINRGEGTVGALLNERALYNQLSSAMTDITATAGEARETVVQARVGLTAFQENMQALKRNFFFRGFFQSRGYMDSTELTKWEIEKIPDAVPVKKFVFLAQELFDKPDTAKLKDKKRLNEVGAYLEKNPFGLVVVQAFCGRAGDHEENLVLTQAQAMVVRDYLADKFEFDDTKLKTKGMGEVAPTEQGRIHWVEISVYAPE